MQKNKYLLVNCQPFRDCLFGDKCRLQLLHTANACNVYCQFPETLKCCACSACQVYRRVLLTSLFFLLTIHSSFAHILPFLSSFLLCCIFYHGLQFLQCDQDQCIQSTKFVLQAAATPLLQSEPSITSEDLPLPGKTTIGAPCAVLTLGQPTPPSSMPNLTSETGLSDMIPLNEDPEGHQFLTPEEAPSPPGMLPLGSPMTHSHTMHVLSLASQDSLHEDSVRGLVKLSSV